MLSSNGEQVRLEYLKSNIAITNHHEIVVLLIHLVIMVMSIFSPTGSYNVCIVLSWLGILAYSMSVRARLRKCANIVYNTGGKTKTNIVYSMREVILLVNSGMFTYYVVNV